MLRGVATVNYRADDMEAAVAWYTELLGVERYFERPGGAPAPQVGASIQPEKKTSLTS
jgi:catechol 2,3-dioxygenase-like lactoylglutathione lyase family enzyme